MEPRAGLDAVAKRQFPSFPLPGIELQSSSTLANLHRQIMCIVANYISVSDECPAICTQKYSG
jgi:hypothetical protein